MLFKPEYLPKPEMLQAFFFEAMQHGYGAAAEQTLPHLIIEGWKRTSPYTKTFNDSYNLQLIDEWSKEGGVTVIRLVSSSNKEFEFVSINLWMMRYYGRYEKSVIPFLKLALQDAYKKGEFCGGRGTEGFRDEEGYPDLVYDNNWSGTFRNFGGHEYINNGHDQQLGEHRFWGGMLV